TLLLIGLLAAGVGLFLGALEFIYKAPRQRLAQLLGLLLLFYALACWYGAFSGQSDPLSPIGRSMTVNSAIDTHAQDASEWQTINTPAELELALAGAKIAGIPLLLDWYADWCISCKVIEHEVLNDSTVVERL